MIADITSCAGFILHYSGQLKSINLCEGCGGSARN